MVLPISFIVGGVLSTGRSVCVAPIFGEFSGCGLFKSSLKCLTHLFRCSQTSVIGLPPMLFDCVSLLTSCLYHTVPSISFSFSFFRHSTRVFYIFPLVSFNSSLHSVLCFCICDLFLALIRFFRVLYSCFPILNFA
ncbi:unnamed protein product [Schistosoma rodhaini]|uniref:Uncharacterized protein n=1 Tax=Schistosoma rodhaini TaxID=6188 RepID=A0AA85FAG7_9TREM|nr:unnamed protein product [Schistosoma rodhaini]